MFKQNVNAAPAGNPNSSFYSAFVLSNAVFKLKSNLPEPCIVAKRLTVLYLFVGRKFMSRYLFVELNESPEKIAEYESYLRDYSAVLELSLIHI